jgi:hypothetical protein
MEMQKQNLSLLEEIRKEIFLLEAKIDYKMKEINELETKIRDLESFKKDLLISSEKLRRF